MKRVGAHTSASGGAFNAVINAKNIGADAFAFFVKNQRQWSAKPLSQEDIERFNIEIEKSEIKKEHILVHNSYLINLGHFDKDLRQKSIDAFLDEIKRVEILGLKLINFHPGSHLKQINEEECLKNISDSMNYLLQNSDEVKLVIENTAGQGSNMGYKFEHLAYLLQNSIDKSRVGVCIDTCHAFSAGYDLKDDYKSVMKQFDDLIGYKYLAGMHLNDSKTEFGSKKDRHESLGKGSLGLKSFENIMKDERIDEIPLILETVDSSIWNEEIELLRKMSI